MVTLCRWLPISYLTDVITVVYRCNRLKCPLARLSGIQCYNMGHNGHAINMYGVIMTIMGNYHACGKSPLGTLSPSKSAPNKLDQVSLCYFKLGAWLRTNKSVGQLVSSQLGCRSGFRSDQSWCRSIPGWTCHHRVCHRIWLGFSS